MALGRRRLAVAARPAFTREDLYFCLELPVLFSLSWLVPERQWLGACTRLEGVKSGIGFFSPQTVATKARRVLSALDSDGKARSFAVRHAARRSEHHLQILKTYRPGGWQPDLRLTGEANLTAALERGHGAVLWVAHFSANALATKIALRRAGYDVWHVSRPEHGFSKSRFGIRWLNPIRARAEERFAAGRIVIDRANPAKAMLAARRVLARNGIVSITAGAWEGGTIATGKLLGLTIELATGAPRLSLLTGAPLLPVFTLFDETGKRLDVTIGERLESHENDLYARLEALTQAFLDRSEPQIRANPDQWRDWKSLQ